MKRLVLNALFIIMILNCMVSAPSFAHETGVPSARISGGGHAPDDKSGPGSKKPSQNAVSDFSRDNPIKIVYPVVMAPYTFKDGADEAQGLAIDLLRLWSKKTGIPIRFTSAAWNESLEMMRGGKADLHASLYYTEERDEYLDYGTVVASSAGGRSPYRCSASGTA